MQYKLFRLLFVLTFVIGLGVVPKPLSVRAAGSWYVSTTGNDANDCMSLATPCATINGAIGKASAGDTINVAVGMYMSSDYFAVVRIEKSITLAGGWDNSFTSQSNMSIIDGQNVRKGIAVYWNTTAVNIDNFVVQNSFSIANQGGGGIYNAGTLILNNSVVRSNTTFCDNCNGYWGGGIFNDQGNLTINNSTISGNSTYAGGGGIYNKGGTVFLNNVTLSGNTTSTYGGGILNDGGIAVVQNSIISGNSAYDGMDCSGAIDSAGYNLIGDTSGCAFTSTTGDKLNEDPLLLGQLVSLAGYYPLLSGSPAIDAGNPAIPGSGGSACSAIDQRGVARPQGSACDMGAYEYTTPGMAVSLLAVSGSGQRVLTTTAFSEPLRVAALDSLGSPVSGMTIDFSAPAMGASGTFADTSTNTTTAPTNDGGVATTSIFTANDQVGTYMISASASGLGPVNFLLEQFVRPANDSFANPVPVPSLPFSRTIDDVTDATIEEGEQQWCYSTDETVWYSFTPSESMIIRTHAQGTANSISGNVNVYHAAGPGISNLQFVSCTGPDGTSTFLAEAGQAYYFQAGSASGQVGGIQIDLEQVPFPANDDFANAATVSLPLPFDNIVDTQYSTRQTGEPTPSCAYYGPGSRSVWYAFTPASSGSYSASIPSATSTPVMAIYTGNSLTNLTQTGCQTYGSVFTFRANAGTTYYFQIGNLYYGQPGGSMQFHLDVTPPPQASFYTNPWDPSKYDTVQFQDSSYDPGQVGLQTYTWDFGDGATATGYSAPHKYAADGDYQVTHTVTTTDGRTATITQTVQVRTHDVAITKITTPASANVGQAKTITVTLRNTAYPETVQIDLYKSTANGFEWVATVTKSVPALSGNRTTAVNFSYTFTSDDATRGKVTFKAVAIIIGARDAYPSDNEAISSITRIAR